MDDRRKLAFDFARDSTKQMITLATAILMATITVIGGFQDKVPSDAEGLIVGAWVAYLGSVIFGAWTLLALTGTLEPKSGDEPASIRGSNVTMPSGLQVIMFLVGTVLAVIAGVVAIL